MTQSRMIGTFAAGTLAEVMLGSRQFGQVESERENIITRSESADHADWSNSNLTISADQVVAPNGELTADRLVETSADGAHALTRSINTVDSESYVFSAYIRTGERTQAGLLASAPGYPGTPSMYFDLESGTVLSSGSVDSYGAVDVGNGWWRLFIAMTADATVSNYHTIYLVDDGANSYPGDTSKGLYVWGMQFEVGTYPSSYIPTAAAAETRNKDELYWAAADVPVLMRDEFAVKIIPNHSSDQIDGDKVLAYFQDTDQDISVYLDSSGRVNVDGATSLIQTAAHTWDYNDRMTIRVNRITGEVTTEGFATGNSVTTGTTWAVTDGNVYWGQDDSTAYQIDGLISEPFNIAG